jgi:hypothetical protein
LFGFPLVVFAGAGGSDGEDPLAFRGPSGADVVPVPDDEGGLGGVVGEQVGLEGGKVERPSVGPCLGDQGLGSTACSSEGAEVTE